MALITETGAGLANAESLISVADADTYHSGVGNTDWAALSVTDKEQALRRATQYMTGAYRLRWLGVRTTMAQALDWPRHRVPVLDLPGFYGFGNFGAYLQSNIVPVVVAQACAELALRASTDSLAPDLTRGILREKVGDLEVEYDQGSPQFVRFRLVELMLRPYLLGGGSSSVGSLSR